MSETTASSAGKEAPADRKGSRLHCTYCGEWGHLNTPCPNAKSDADYLLARLRDEVVAVVAEGMWEGDDQRQPDYDRIAELYDDAASNVTQPAPEAATGRDMIAAERRRQVEVEGYTAEHDAEHGGFTLAQAAYCYKAYGLHSPGAVPTQWPLDWAAWKPRDPISNLIRAGALYLAAHEQGYPGAQDSARCAAAIDASRDRLAAQPAPEGEDYLLARLRDEVIAVVAEGLWDGDSDRGQPDYDRIAKLYDEAASNVAQPAPELTATVEEALTKADEALSVWEQKGPTSLTVALVVEALRELRESVRRKP